ncbi:hypothetical protein U1Q18_046340 [Sarracenia purpurea var. burkii]
MGNDWGWQYRKARGLAGRLGGCHGWWERGGSGKNGSKRVDVAAIREDCSGWQELGESEERRKKKRDKPCDICGDIGFLDAIVECSQCKIAHEHLKLACENFPDDWLCEQCEVCKMGSIVSPKSTLLSNPSGRVDQENECSTRRNRHAKWEKIVKTGKVKYIPALEAITLSSGAKKFGYLSQSNMHSSYGPTEIVGPMSKMTHIKPKVSKSILNVKANHSFRSLGNLPTGQGSTQTHPVVQQQVTQRSKDPKAPRKEHVHTTQPIVALIPAVKIKNSIMKEGKVMNKAAGGSSQVMHFPPMISSGEIAWDQVVFFFEVGSGDWDVWCGGAVMCPFAGLSLPFFVVAKDRDVC